MLTIFLFIKKTIRYLNSNENIKDIALSLTIATLIGITPLNIPLLILLLLILILRNGNLLIFLFIYPFFEIIDVLFYPIFHKTGNYLLTNTNLIPIWELIYNLPGLIFFNWNNTVQFGSYCFIIIFFYPLFLCFIKLLTGYREKILPKIKKNKLLKIFKLPKWVIILFKD